MKILIIGDTHITKDDCLERIYALKSIIIKNKPQKIIIIGDFLEMACLSHWDKNNTQKMEGQRLKQEIDLGNKALDIIQSFFKNEIIYIEGNHEDRLARYIKKNAGMDGILNLDIQLKLKDRKIKFIRYKDNYNLKNISFTHIPIAANNQPISGKDATNKALNMYSNSVIFGHTHRKEMTSLTRYNGEINTALSVGCYFEKDKEEHQVSNQHWRGLIILDIFKENDFDIQTIAFERVMEQWDGSKVVNKIQKETTTKRVKKVTYDYSSDKHK